MCVFCSRQCLNLVIFLVKGLGKYGVLFHNSLIIVIPTLLASAFTGDLHKVRAFYHQFKSICVCVMCVFSSHLTTLRVLWHHRLSRLKAGLKPRLYFASSCPASWGRVAKSHTTRAPLASLRGTEMMMALLCQQLCCVSSQVCPDVFHSAVQLL